MLNNIKEFTTPHELTPTFPKNKETDTSLTAIFNDRIHCIDQFLKFNRPDQACRKLYSLDELLSNSKLCAEMKSKYLCIINEYNSKLNTEINSLINIWSQSIESDINKNNTYFQIFQYADIIAAGEIGCSENISIFKKQAKRDFSIQEIVDSCEKNAQQVLIKLIQAECLLSMNNIPLAESCLQEVENHNPNLFYLKLINGKLQERKKCDCKAEEIYKDLAQKYPNAIEPLIGLAIIYNANKQWLEASIYSSKALQLDPDNLRMQIVYDNAKNIFK
ncbi:MAG: hypothetical protein VX777_04370 [Chlamydiota bacterium]|nr:hypothetical protein [Chlamydiota bacterium]